MTASPSRVPPTGFRDIALTYQHRHPWWFDADTAPEAWLVSADIYDDSGLDTEVHVGDFRIVALDIDQVRDPFGLLDGEDADLGLIAETVFGGGRDLVPDLESLLEPFGSRILILCSARLEPGWRGFGLGALLAGTAIRKLGAGGRAAICYPAPIGDAGEEEPSEAAREQAIRALGRVWAGLGFEHFRDGIHVLDLNLATLDMNLARLRKNTQRYQDPVA